MNNQITGEEVVKIINVINGATIEEVNEILAKKEEQTIGDGIVSEYNYNVEDLEAIPGEIQELEALISIVPQIGEIHNKYSEKWDEAEDIDASQIVSEIENQVNEAKSNPDNAPKIIDELLKKITQTQEALKKQASEKREEEEEKDYDALDQEVEELLKSVGLEGKENFGGIIEAKRFLEKNFSKEFIPRIIEELEETKKLKAIRGKDLAGEVEETVNLFNMMGIPLNGRVDVETTEKKLDIFNKAAALKVDPDVPGITFNVDMTKSKSTNQVI